MSRTLHLALLVLVLLAVSAPVAQGDDWFRDGRTTTTHTAVRPDDRPGLLGVGGVTGGPKVDPLAASYLLNMGFSPAQVEAWATGICSYELELAECFPTPTVAALAPTAQSGSFDWTAAGIGASATLGFVLLAAGLGAGLVSVRQNRKRRVANA